jgi:HEAT repeat protein
MSTFAKALVLVSVFKDPAVGRLVAQALELRGNPDAAPSLQPLVNDADPATREAAKAALLWIGPGE